MGSHLVANQTDASCSQDQIFIPNVADSTMVGSNGNQAEKSGVNLSQHHIILSDFSSTHPSAHLSRKETTEVERQNININAEYGREIDFYMRQLEVQYLTDNSLANHKITANLRARMVDWMIEVLTNFKCEDQTFFLAISLLDRYLKNKRECQEIADLHIMGVTTMFIASKYEDIYPLKMKMVFEKIAHKKLSIERIKALELDMLKQIHYKIPAPTVLDFLKIYLKEVLEISHVGNTSLKKEEKEAIPTSSDSPEGQKHLIYKMAMYLSKMSLHDYDLSGRKPSLVAVGSLYVALKICEQLKKATLITNSIV
jgi:cyclin A